MLARASDLMVPLLTGGELGPLAVGGVDFAQGWWRLVALLGINKHLWAYPG